MNKIDLLKLNIGKEVYLSSDKDLSINRHLRYFIQNKIKLTLIKITKGGMAVITDDNHKQYSVAPKNIVICQT